MWAITHKGVDKEKKKKGTYRKGFKILRTCTIVGSWNTPTINFAMEKDSPIAKGRVTIYDHGLK